MLQDLSSTNFKSYQELIDFIYFRFNYIHKPSQDISVIIDKKPSYSLHVDVLLKLNPESKFIYLVRDYRANILSRKQSIEGVHPNTAFNAYRWLFFNKTIHTFKHRFPDKILEIKYEDLVTDTSTTINKIISFLNLSTTDTDVMFYQEGELNSSQIDTNNSLLNQRIQKTREDLGKPF
ncbi:MAG: sulfotransferase [Bacteroidetes bacterium]|nr:sulfotransferase [Bacteroidota bacterium]